MSDSRSFASLSSALLARKGEARPAMRPQALQIGNNPDASHAILEDLGWNDMGHEVVASMPGTNPEPSPEPPVVVQQQEELSSHFVGPADGGLADIGPADSGDDTVSQLPLSGINPGFIPRVVVAAIAPAPAPLTAPPHMLRAAPGSKGKSAFTLRLDAQRHLHLRMVCAVNHRSAQQIVTQALDEFLARQPELAELGQRACG